jgi:hypothetical protein
MKRAKAIAIAQTTYDWTDHLPAIVLWAAAFSVSVSFSLFAAAIYIH